MPCSSGTASNTTSVICGTEPQPSLPGLGRLLGRRPNVETLGYCPASLRDEGARTACVPLLRRIPDAKGEAFSARFTRSGAKRPRAAIRQPGKGRSEWIRIVSLSRAERDKPCSWESRTRRASDAQAATVMDAGLPVNLRTQHGFNFGWSMSIAITI